MNIDFYKTAKVLDDIKDLQNPSEDQIKIILNLISEEKFARYFFTSLENPVWVIPLYKSNFFHSAPAPVEVQPGSFQLPSWPAGQYLVRFADRHEEIVLDVVQSIRTENWRVQEILVDALLKISPATAAGLVPSINGWLSGRFSDMLPDKLIPLADHLREAGFIDAAIQILEYVITPILPPNVGEYSKYHSPVRFRSDHYWVNEYCEKQLLKLMTVNPVSVVSAFERQLDKTIELTSQVIPDDVEIKVGYYWRMDIPNRLSEQSDADALDILIDGLRDGLAEVCNKSIDEGRKIIDTYLSSQHLIFRRIALHTLRTYGQSYPKLLSQAFLRRDFLENAEYGNEYRGLMRDQFTNVSEDVRSQVISWILSGPLDADSRANRRAQLQNREATEGELREVREDWAWFHLEIIRDFLAGEALDRLEELTALHGKPNIEERPHIVTSSWGGAPSPVPVDELVKKSFDELKQLFVTYVPEDLFLNPRESLAETFQRLVREDPTRYGDFASYLIDPAIRFVYIYHYLSGIRESLKNKDGKLGDAIIGLCEYVVAQKEDPFEDSSERHETGLLASQLEVARLIEEAHRSDDPYLTREQLDRSRSLLIILAHNSDPGISDDASSSFDPFTHSLNCVRGVAMHGIMQYSLYIIRQQDKLSDEKPKTRFLEPEIREILEEKLDLKIEPSLAVHSIYGAYIPQLHYLAHEWLEDHLDVVFPEDEERNVYWKAAWDAYIFTSNVYRDVFILLVPQYQRGVRLLIRPQGEQKHIGGSTNERLAQHLLFAYLADLTDFGHENMLLDAFFANAPDSVRANGIFWLSQVLRNDKPSADDTLWKKCWTLWQNRLKNAETQEVSCNTLEISDYMRWLENCPVGLDLLYPTLCQTVKYLHKGVDAMQLISYAANHCEGFPLEAVTLLKMTILEAKEPWWAPKEEDEEVILKTAMASGDRNARQIALEVINYRGERGDFRWKRLLD